MSSAYNLIGTGGSGGLSNGVNHNIVLTGSDGPGLAPLGNYGGPTQTMALLPGSPAIGAGIARQRHHHRPARRAAGTRPARRHRRLPEPGLHPRRRSRAAAQSADVSTAFPNPLVGTVMTEDSANEPVAGGSLTFTAPASGASASLTAGTATTGSGQASVTATANNTAGSYTVTASATGVATPADFALTNNSTTARP